MPEVAASLDLLFDAPYPEAVARAASAGVDAVEFFDWEGADLDAVDAALREHDVAVAATLAAGAGSNIAEDGPSLADPRCREQAVADVERSIEAASDVGADCLIVTTGPARDDVADDDQHQAVVDALAEASPAAEAAGVTLVLEPLNVAVDHPGYFLPDVEEGAAIVEAVDSPRVKLLYDVYHRQVTAGDVIRTLRTHADAIGHVHVADVPGRHEPGTGELNYRNVLAALDDVGYDSYVGCEFSPTVGPEEALSAVTDLAAGPDRA